MCIYKINVIYHLENLDQISGQCKAPRKCCGEWFGDSFLSVINLIPFAIVTMHHLFLMQNFALLVALNFSVGCLWLEK